MGISSKKRRSTNCTRGGGEERRGEGRAGGEKRKGEEERRGEGRRREEERGGGEKRRGEGKGKGRGEKRRGEGKGKGRRGEDQTLVNCDNSTIQSTSVSIVSANKSPH